MFYLRDRNAQCREVDTLEELLEQFESADGYRISITDATGRELTIWRSETPRTDTEGMRAPRFEAAVEFTREVAVPGPMLRVV